MKYFQPELTSARILKFYLTLFFLTVKSWGLSLTWRVLQTAGESRRWRVLINVLMVKCPVKWDTEQRKNRIQQLLQLHN